MPHHHSAGPDRTLECRELYKHSETFRENHKTRGRKVWGGGIAFCCQESFAGISGIHPVSSTMVNVNITVGTHICLLQRTPVCSTVNEWAEYRSLAGQSLNISFASSRLYWNQPRVTYNPPMQLELFPKSIVKGKRHTYIFFQNLIEEIFTSFSFCKTINSVSSGFPFNFCYTFQWNKLVFLYTSQSTYTENMHL